MDKTALLIVAATLLAVSRLVVLTHQDTRAS
jgi:hypothetical protein